MSPTPIKSASVRNAVKIALGAAVAAPLLIAAGPASAADVQVGDTTVDIGGFVRSDFYYDFEQASGASLMPNDATNVKDDDAAFGASAQYSRLTFSINTPTSVGDVGGYVEADFFGGSRTLRLRQAYVTYGNWLIGKAWTTFANFHYGPTVDFGGPSGQVFGRDKQIRYTMDLGNGNLAFAVEATQSGVGSEPSPTLYSPGDSSNQVLPTLVMRYQGSAGIFSYQAAAMVRQLEAQLTGASSEDSVTSWGVNLGGTVALPTGTSLKLSAVYGEALGAYVLGVPGYDTTTGTGVYDTYWDANGNLEANSELGVTVTVAQKFTKHLSAALVYGYDEVETGSNDVSVTGQSATVGMFYSPVAPLTFGVGYKYVNLDNETWANDKDANRVTFSTTYSF